MSKFKILVRKDIIFSPRKNMQVVPLYYITYLPFPPSKDIEYEFDCAYVVPESIRWDSNMHRFIIIVEHRVYDKSEDIGNLQNIINSFTDMGWMTLEQLEQKEKSEQIVPEC